MFEQELRMQCLSAVRDIKELADQAEQHLRRPGVDWPEVEGKLQSIREETAVDAAITELRAPREL